MNVPPTSRMKFEKYRPRTAEELRELTLTVRKRLSSNRDVVSSDDENDAFLSATEGKADKVASVDVEVTADGSTKLMLAAAMSDATAVDDVRELLRLGASCAHRNLDGTTPLIAAVKTGTTATLKLLCERASDVDATNNNNDTPLMIAVCGNKVAHASILLSMGASPNKKSVYGSTPLHMATYELRSSNDPRSYSLIVALVLCGADVNARDRNGGSCLQWLCNEHHPLAFRATMFLLDHKAESCYLLDPPHMCMNRPPSRFEASSPYMIEMALAAGVVNSVSSMLI